MFVFSKSPSPKFGLGPVPYPALANNLLQLIVHQTLSHLEHFFGFFRTTYLLCKAGRLEIRKYELPQLFAKKICSTTLNLQFQRQHCSRLQRSSNQKKRVQNALGYPCRCKYLHTTLAL
jgi:hypothetical protein